MDSALARLPAVGYLGKSTTQWSHCQYKSWSKVQINDIVSANDQLSIQKRPWHTGGYCTLCDMAKAIKMMYYHTQASIRMQDHDSRFIYQSNVNSDVRMEAQSPPLKSNPNPKRPGQQAGGAGVVSGLKPMSDVTQQSMTFPQRLTR